MSNDDVPASPADEGRDDAAPAKAALNDVLVELARLSDERDNLDRRVKELTGALEDALVRTGERDRIIAELERQIFEERCLAASTARAREKEDRRELLLRRTARAVQAFRSRFENELEQYRSQRAWKVMLFLRKAYALAVRQGWRGRLRLAGDLLGTGSRAGRGLDAYELQFADILGYVPGELLTAPPRAESPADEPPGTSPAGTGRTAPRYARPLAHHDVIVLPVFEFDFRMQRPQHLAEQFALRGHRVFWVSPARVPLPASARPYQIVELRENLWEVHLGVEHANVYLGQLSEELVEEHSACLRELYRDCGIAASCVLVQLPFWRRLALSLREAFGTRIIYDCMDDWESMPDLSDFTRSEDKALARDCDTLVVSSRQLQAKYREQELSPLLARNGVDFEFFSAASPGGLLARLRKPVVGYFGAIADWFDYDLLYQVARSRPEYSFTLAGDMGLEEAVLGEKVRKLKSLENVHLLGHKPYSQIPSYLAEFDACIIPFVLNQVTHATDPVKLYEYLSQGKPVVTTAMGEMAEFQDLLYIASDAGDFAQKLDLALQEGDAERQARRIRFASENTWSARINAIESAVADSFPMVSVIIVTHNSGAFVEPCLDSLRRNTCYPRWEAIVVDNNSEDNTADLVEKYTATDPRIRLIRQPGNMGFAAANNFGVRSVGGEYLVFLNMDTVVTPGWMGRLLRHAFKDSSLGMVVPVTNCAGNEVQVKVCYDNLQEMEEAALDRARDSMGIGLDLRVGPLFCALIPRAVWDKVGELDERFGVGMFEDDDYSHRLARAGYRLSTAEDCFVHHFGQGAFSKLSRERYQAVFEENRRRFEQKWGFSWIPHTYRPGVGENRRFSPARFVQP